MDVPGFTTVRADRDCRRSGKCKSGGLALFINNRWCSPGHVTVKETECNRDIELLAVGLRPYYMPREFSHGIVVCVTFLRVHTPRQRVTLSTLPYRGCKHNTQTHSLPSPGILTTSHWTHTTRLSSVCKLPPQEEQNFRPPACQREGSLHGHSFAPTGKN